MISNCNRSGYSDDLRQLLPEIQQALRRNIIDLDSGTTSVHGFRTFFKSNSNVAIIKSVFQAIIAGANTNSGDRPIIECLNPEDMTEEDQIEVYNKFCRSARRGVVEAMDFPKTSLVVLCPRFWDHPRFPISDDCIDVNGRRGRAHFSERGLGLIHTRFSSLVHELVHLYNPLDAAYLKGEVYSAQECMALDADRSMENASNWALYAACKFNLSCWLQVRRRLDC